MWSTTQKVDGLHHYIFSRKELGTEITPTFFWNVTHVTRYLHITSGLFNNNSASFVIGNLDPIKSYEVTVQHTLNQTDSSPTSFVCNALPMIVSLAQMTSTAYTGVSNMFTFQSLHLVNDSSLPYIKIIPSYSKCDDVNGYEDAIDTWARGPVAYTSNNLSYFLLTVPVVVNISTNNKFCYSTTYNGEGKYNLLADSGLFRLNITISTPRIILLKETTAPSGKSITLHMITAYLIDDDTRPYIKLVPSTALCSTASENNNDAIGEWAKGQIDYDGSSKSATFILSIPVGFPATYNNKICYSASEHGVYKMLHGGHDTINTTLTPPTVTLLMESIVPSGKTTILNLNKTQLVYVTTRPFI
jgi:hypothetical protein